MRLSLFSNARDNQPYPWDLQDWDHFVHEFTEDGHKLVDIDVTAPPEELTKAKESLMAFSPAEYPEGVKRSKQHVRRVHLLVFDVDNRSDEELMDFIEQAEGLAMLVTSTFSRGLKPGARARVIMPLSRPVLRDEWPAFWNTTSALFGHVGDPQCKDPSRMYFGLFAPKSMAHECFILVKTGVHLPVDDLLDDPPDLPVPPPEKLMPVAEAQFVKFAKKQARKSNDRDAELGEMLVKITDGEIFAEPGVRDESIYKLSLLIARRWPEGDASQIASYFSKSLELMSEINADCPKVDNVEYKIQRAQQQLRQLDAEKDQKEGRVRRKRIKQAFKGKRTKPYSDEELESFGDVDWVVQKAKSYYFFVDGEYVGPFTEADAGNAALSLLAPASAAIELFRVGKGGDIIKKPINQLVAEYGSVAKTVQLDMRVSKSTFDSINMVLTEAPCPLRPIEPKFHPQIDEWLSHMCGNKKPEVNKWLSKVTDLDNPCVILFLTGPKDTGKSLFAKGVARHWTTQGPTSLEEVFSDFNEGLARCPLCFADEQLPKDFRGYTKNGELREHVQATMRTYKRKYLPNSKLLGATRTVIAANNEDILRTQENLSANDIGAIVDRYLHVPTNVAAAEYLNRADVDTTGWVAGDMIAEHSAWLRDHLDWKPEGRFLIRVWDEQLSRSLANRSGDRSSVCQWLVSYLLNPNRFDDDARGKMYVQINKGRLCVNTQGLYNCWGLYIDNEKCPPTGRLASAISALSLPDRAKLNNEEGTPTNFRVIDKANLITWSRDTGFATDEEIDAALKIDTKNREDRSFLN